jgi:hypothetical protein
VSATLQGDHLWFSFTPISLSKVFTKKPSVFLGTSIGLNAASADQETRDNRTAGLAYADGPGGGFGSTWHTPDSGSSRDFHPYGFLTWEAGLYAQGSMVDSWKAF